MTKLDNEIKQQMQEKERREQHKIDTLGKQLFEKKLEKDMVSKGKVTIPNHDSVFNEWSYAYKWVRQNMEELKDRGYYTKNGIDEVVVRLGEDLVTDMLKSIKGNNQRMTEFTDGFKHDKDVPQDFLKNLKTKKSTRN